MKIVIDRKKWIRGVHPTQEAALRTTYFRKKRLQCCLGFACKAIGMTDREIEYHGLPADAIESLLDEADGYGSSVKQNRYDYLFERMKEAKLVGGSRKWPRDSALSWRAMVINDRDDLTEAERERKLTNLFKRYGHRLVFIG